MTVRGPLRWAGGRVLALGVLAVGFAVTFLVRPWHDESVTDLPLYSAYAQLFLDGNLPYRDVAFEYPPLAAPVIAVAGLAGDAASYRAAFTAITFVFAALVVLLCGALAGVTGADRRRALLVAAAAPLLCGAMIRTHFDLVPVAITLVALLLVCRDRPRVGMAVLGLGVAVKLYPVVIAPVALAWLLARGQRRAAADGLLALAAVVVVAYAGALALSVPGTIDSFRYHVDRAVQVESTPAVILRALDWADVGAATPDDGHRSDGLDHPASAAVTGVSSALLLLAIGALAWGMTRGDPPGNRDLVLAALAATVAFACLGKVLSPQYLIWVVPLMALAYAWRMPVLAALAGGALVLTLLEFPAHYREVVDRVPWVLALVAVRDALLIGVVAVAVFSSRPARGAAPARSRWRGHRGRPRSAPH